MNVVERLGPPRIAGQRTKPVAIERSAAVTRPMKPRESQSSSDPPQPLVGMAHDMVGEVKWFDIKKGYGFIQSALNGDVFVHHSVLPGSGFRLLWHRQAVVFDAEMTSAGWKATRIGHLDATEDCDGQ